MKSAIATLLAVFFVGLAIFWLQWDVLREYSYNAYLRANVIYLETPDFKFASDPLFWLVLVASNAIVFSVAGAVGIAVGRSIRGVMFAACAAVGLHFMLRYVPRASSLTWEYHFAALIETATALLATYVGARFVTHATGSNGRSMEVPSSSA